MEYGLIHYYPYDTKSTISKIQNKFLRLITKSPYDCPINSLQCISDIEPINIRYEYLVQRNLARIKHSDKYHPLTKTYNNLHNKIDFIENHGHKYRRIYKNKSTRSNNSTNSSCKIKKPRKPQPPNRNTSNIALKNIHNNRKRKFAKINDDINNPIQKRFLQISSINCEPPNKIQKSIQNKLINITKNSIVKAEQLIKSDTINSVHIFSVNNSKIIRQQITASPTYMLRFLPDNFEVVLDDTDPILPIINDILKIFTDGSCVPNPGKGASAFHIPKQPAINFRVDKHFSFKIPVTITITEATAINMVLNYILNSSLHNITNIYIYIDNKPILLFLKYHSFPKYNRIDIYKIIANKTKVP